MTFFAVLAQETGTLSRQSRRAQLGFPCCVYLPFQKIQLPPLPCAVFAVHFRLRARAYPAMLDIPPVKQQPKQASQLSLVRLSLRLGVILVADFAVPYAFASDTIATSVVR